jgi:ABC-type polysaccharide/polyol phosphate transport system ATPase subunit
VLTSPRIAEINEIRQTCDRAVWLNGGVIERVRSVDDVLDEYEQWSDDR